MNRLPWSPKKIFTAAVPLLLKKCKLKSQLLVTSNNGNTVLMKPCNTLDDNNVLLHKVHHHVSMRSYKSQKRQQSNHFKKHQKFCNIEKVTALQLALMASMVACKEDEKDENTLVDDQHEQTIEKEISSQDQKMFPATTLNHVVKKYPTCTYVVIFCFFISNPVNTCFILALLSL